MGYAILTKNLSKKFKEITAVDAIELKIKEGELFGLLGPNGAGKTTTIKMLATLLKPTLGKAEVAGYDIIKEKGKVREKIGIVFQDPSLDSELTGKENLDFHGRMYGMDKELREKRIENVLKLVELEEKRDVLVKNYSGGMQRRLEIARGLMHYPKVLFLDEPTLGLDAQTRRNIWEYIKKLNKKEKITIILTTHYMEEADYLCERIAIIDHGKVIALGTPQNLKNSISEDVVSLKVDKENNKFKKELEKCEWVKKVVNHNNFLNLSVENGERKIPEIMKVAEEANSQVSSVNLRKPTLEDVFLRLTGKTIREEEAKRKNHVRARIQRIRVRKGR